ncbi:MAG: ATP-binding protein [Steroidobacteraceae bacterium]
MPVALLGCAGRGPDYTRVTRAERAYESPSTAANAPLPDSIPASLRWETVTLPMQDTSIRRFDRIDTVRLWLRLDLSGLKSVGEEPLAVAFSAFQPSGFHAVLFVNGVRETETDSSRSNYWNQPQLLPVPRRSATGPIDLVLAVDCSVGVMGCSAPSFMVGSLSAVTSWYELQQFLRVDISKIASMAMLAIGAFAMLFWVRGRHDSAFLLFAVASLLWTLRSLHYHLPNYPQPQWLFWWLTVSSLNWLCFVVYLFAIRLRGESRPRTERALAMVAVVLTLLRLPVLPLVEWWQEQLVYAAQAMTSLLITLMLTVDAFRVRTREQMALSMALWISLAFGIHDELLDGGLINMESVFWLPFAAAPIFGAFIYALARRYSAAVETAESLNASLETTLAARQAELAQSYERLSQFERDSARDAERQRLMREMHDGLGSTLVSTLVAAERPETDHAQIVDLLRDAVGELRLLIDSTDLADDDLETALGNLRYRLAARVAQLGIAIEWHMDNLPALPWLDAASILQVLRIVQESVANAIKHSGASVIRIETRANEHICITISDNGRGFDVAATEQAPAGRGLANLRYRARQLNAHLDICSSGSGSTLRLMLPTGIRST